MVIGLIEYIYDHIRDKYQAYKDARRNPLEASMMVHVTTIKNVSQPCRYPDD